MVDPTLLPFLQRLDTNPEDEDALDQVWSLLHARNQFEVLATLAERVAARRGNRTAGAELFYRAGDLWVDPLKRPDRAVAAFEHALLREPQHLPALKALGEIHVRANRLEAAAPLYERRLALCIDPRDRAAVLDDLLQIREQQKDVAAQTTLLKEILTLRPRDREVKKRLARLLVQRARRTESEREKREAAQLLGALATQADAAQRAVLAEGALELWPGDENAYSVLDAMYQREGRIADLSQRREAFLACNGESRLAIRVRKDLAAQHAAAGAIERAIDVLEPIAQDPDAIRLLTEYYRSSGRQADLAALMMAQDDSVEDPLEAMREQVALRRRNGDATALRAALKELLRVDPSNADGWAEIERDCRARGAFTELRDLLRNVPPTLDASLDARSARLKEIARISEFEIDDDPGAIEAWRQLLAIFPDDAEGAEALERLLARQGNFAEVLQLLERRARTDKDPATRKALWLRHLEYQQLHRHDAAQEAEILTRLWTDDPEDDRVALALVAARRRAGDVSGVTEVLRMRVDDAAPDNAAMRWTELASHLENSGQSEGALAAWHKVRTLDPDQSYAWECEERLLALSGSQQVLLDTLEAHANQVIGAAGRAGALLTRAATVSKVLGDVPRSVALAERARRLLPDDESLMSLADRASSVSSAVIPEQSSTENELTGRFVADTTTIEAREGEPTRRFSHDEFEDTGPVISEPERTPVSIRLRADDETTNPSLATLDPPPTATSVTAPAADLRADEGDLEIQVEFDDTDGAHHPVEPPLLPRSQRASVPPSVPIVPRLSGTTPPSLPVASAPITDRPPPPLAANRLAAPPSLFAPIQTPALPTPPPLAAPPVWGSTPQPRQAPSAPPLLFNAPAPAVRAVPVPSASQSAPTIPPFGAGSPFANLPSIPRKPAYLRTMSTLFDQLRSGQRR